LAENPLLPHAELRALLALTQRARKLETAAARHSSRSSRTRFAAPGSREALLAAVALQVKPGDVLLSEPGDTTPAALTRPAAEVARAPSPALLPELRTQASRFLLATAVAAGLKAARTERMLALLTRNGAVEPGWQEALAWAQDRQLPLVLVCADPRGAAAFSPATRAGKRSPAALDWTAVHTVTTRLQIPILTVDGEDAVAVYRAMQESILRARSGGGPALLWTMLPSPRELQGRRAPSAEPLARLRQYLRARKISF
jgi:TPP-dependent pyruvate/acetoin dehydrogenase alpha subunit